MRIFMILQNTENIEEACYVGKGSDVAYWKSK